jgi:hypothetical protein
MIWFDFLPIRVYTLPRRKANFWRKYILLVAGSGTEQPVDSFWLIVDRKYGKALF